MKSLGLRIKDLTSDVLMNASSLGTEGLVLGICLRQLGLVHIHG